MSTALREGVFGFGITAQAIVGPTQAVQVGAAFSGSLSSAFLNELQRFFQTHVATFSQHVANVVQCARVIGIHFQHFLKFHFGRLNVLLALIHRAAKEPHIDAVFVVLRELFGGVQGLGHFAEFLALVIDLGQGDVGLLVVLAVQQFLHGRLIHIRHPHVRDQQSASHKYYAIGGPFLDRRVRFLLCLREEFPLSAVGARVMDALTRGARSGSTSVICLKASTA